MALAVSVATTTILTPPSGIPLSIVRFDGASGATQLAYVLSRTVATQDVAAALYQCTSWRHR